MPLIEGLDDAVREEYGRFLDELRLAIAESGYNVTELCALAQIEPKTYYRLMAGNDVKLRDTAMRLLFAVGGRFEISRPKKRKDEKGSHPFQAVPLATATRGSSRSTTSQGSGNRSAGGGVDKTQKTAASKIRTVAEQRKKSAAKKRPNRRCEKEAA